MHRRFAPAAAPAKPGTDAIDDEIRTILVRHHTPGASVKVVRRGKPVYAGAFGMRDVARRLDAGLNTRFEIGSITKEFTAAAILQLQQSGRLEIDATLATYLPQAPHAREVTLRQLLAHTSGIPEYFDTCDGVSKPIAFDDLIARVSGKPLDFVPGSRWRYSNTGYILLGRVIEVVSNETYDQYVRVHLLNKAGMTRTRTIADEPVTDDMSAGYVVKNGEAAPAPALSESFAWSAGNLVSTVDDVQRWNAALAGGRIIPPRVYAQMSTSAFASDGTATNYGFGLFVDTLEDQPRIGHTGHSCGFAAEDEYFPRQDTRIVVLTNSATGPAESIVTVLFNHFFPEVAAAAWQAGAGEEPAMTARVKALVTSLFEGHVTRSELTDDEYAELAGQVTSGEFASAGEPGAFLFKRKIDRPFGPVYVYWVKFGTDIQRLVVQLERKTDRFNTVSFATASDFGAKR